MLRDLPPIARKLYGLLENDRFEVGEDGEEWQAYWMGAPLFAAWGRPAHASATMWPRWPARARRIASHPGTGYRFARERVAVDGDLVQQLVVWRPAGSAGRRVPRLLRGAAGRAWAAEHAMEGSSCAHACARPRRHAAAGHAGHDGEPASVSVRGPRIVTVTAAKGGVGKTTLAYELAAALGGVLVEPWTGMPEDPTRMWSWIGLGPPVRRCSTPWSAGPRGGLRG